MNYSWYSVNCYTVSKTLAALTPKQVIIATNLYAECPPPNPTPPTPTPPTPNSHHTLPPPKKRKEKKKERENKKEQGVENYAWQKMMLKNPASCLYKLKLIIRCRP